MLILLINVSTSQLTVDLTVTKLIQRRLILFDWFPVANVLYYHLNADIINEN